MASIICPHCGKNLDTPVVHCIHCNMRLPGAPSKPAPKRRSAAGPRPRRAPAGYSQPVAKEVAKDGTKGGIKDTGALQCPACAHAVALEDEWCKWCKWPVNRRA